MAQHNLFASPTHGGLLMDDGLGMYGMPGPTGKSRPNKDTNTLFNGCDQYSQITFNDPQPQRDQDAFGYHQTSLGLHSSYGDNQNPTGGLLGTGGDLISFDSDVSGHYTAPGFQFENNSSLDYGHQILTHQNGGGSDFLPVSTEYTLKGSFGGGIMTENIMCSSAEYGALPWETLASSDMRESRQRELRAYEKPPQSNRDDEKRRLNAVRARKNRVRKANEKDQLGQELEDTKEEIRELRFEKERREGTVEYLQFEYDRLLNLQQSSVGEDGQVVPVATCDLWGP